MYNIKVRKDRKSRYIVDKNRKIRISNEMSELDLIKWILKQYGPKKRRYKRSSKRDSTDLKSKVESSKDYFTKSSNLDFDELPVSQRENPLLISYVNTVRGQNKPHLALPDRPGGPIRFETEKVPDIITTVGIPDAPAILPEIKEEKKNYAIIEFNNQRFSIPENLLPTVQDIMDKAKLQEDTAALQVETAALQGKTLILAEKLAIDGAKTELKEYYSKDELRDMLTELKHGSEVYDSPAGKKWNKKQILQYLIDNKHPLIEQEYRKKINTHMQRGNGLVQRVKDIWNGIRRKASPSVRKFAKEHGSKNIVKIIIGRQPIRSFVDTAASWLSLG